MSKLSNTNYPLAFLVYNYCFLISYLYFLSFYVFYIIFKILGDYSDEVHLFPFRTEKLSSSAQMVLQLYVGEYVVATFKLASIL